MTLIASQNSRLLSACAQIGGFSNSVSQTAFAVSGNKSIGKYISPNASTEKYSIDSM